MRHIQIAYKNSPDFLNRLLELRNYYEDHRLGQIFFYVTWAGDVKGKLLTAIDKIEEIFPDAIYYGNEASGNIAQGDLSFGINISCYIFENAKSKAELVWVEKDTKIANLDDLWRFCKYKKHLKGIELIPTTSYLEYLKLDKNEPTIDKDVIIFGGSACAYDLPCVSSDIIAKGYPKTSEGMAVVLYSGEDLHFAQNHVLGWQGLGRQLTVTKSEGKIIKELDGQKPLDVYEKYLGTELANSDCFIFPLISYEDGVEYLRTPFRFLEDGTMEVFVNLDVGTKTRLSYGDRNTILKSVYKTALKISEFKPEVIRTYSCAARRLFWGDDQIGKETTILEQISPVSGFYSGGEILRFGNTIRILNQTLSIISAREYNGSDEKPAEVENQDEDKTMLSRLAYFTRKVTQEQEEALKEAELASKAKTEFLFNMSHDIRTPLNAIIGFSNIAKREIKNEEVVDDSLNKIRDSSDILLSIINDILDMSRIESGKINTSVENFDINEIFNKIEPIMKSLAALNNVDVTFKTVNLNNPYVSTDIGIVERVLINVISNAIKYSNKGGNVLVTLKQSDSDVKNTKIYKFIVQDNGIGMSKDFQTRMFDEFAREENTTVSGIQGTGLGLPLALKLSQLLGGEISCISEQGVGSTFTITFKFNTVDKESIFEEDEEELAKAIDLKGRKALVVEDNKLNMDITVDMLTQEGVVCECAQNGKEALETLAKRGPSYYDFILMDIQMPIMDGYQTTKAIRKIYPDDKMIIIAVSANAFVEDKKASLDAGMNRHIAKPINILELKKVMSKCLHK